MMNRIREGMALEKSGRLKDAASIYFNVTEQAPDNAEAWHRLGQVTAKQLNPEGALPFLNKAIDLEPGNSRFHNSLGSVLAQVGRIDSARDSMEQALRLDPDNADAYYNLSKIVTFSCEYHFIEQVEKLLKRAKTAPERLFLHFAAGKYYDDVSNYECAFFHYQSANAAKNARFSPEQYWRFVRALLTTFDADFIAERFGKGEASEQPVFIVGMPRSGTSLVENILASHSQVFGADELTDIEAISNAIQKYSASGNPYPTALRDVPDAVIKEFAQRYLERLRDLAPTAQRIVNKMPTNFEHLGLIALMLPNARIIHCKRNRIDTCLSCYFQNFSHRQLDFSYDLFHLRFFWDCYKRLMEHWANVLPVQIFEITYEQLVVNQETQTRELLEFCGLNWEPECAAPHLNQRPVQTASRWQVRQPVYTSSIGRWRNYEKHIAPLTDGPSFVAEKF